MEKKSKQYAVLLTVGFLVAVGCDGGKYPTVSGTVTANGEPVAMVRVVFMPMAVGDNHTPGPWSKGVSDETGHYTLQTRYGDPGAVVGPHKVGFLWDDIDFDEMSDLRAESKSGQGAKAQAAKTRLEKIKQKMASRPKLKAYENLTFEVSKEGATNADFEVGE